MEELRGPCFICGDPDDHGGVPHREATGDETLRRDVPHEHEAGVAGTTCRFCGALMSPADEDSRRA